jgi:phospholipase A1
MLITGHSLGAALATFAAVDIKENLNPKRAMHVYNFGSPRTGNQAFTDLVMGMYPEE